MAKCIDNTVVGNLPLDNRAHPFVSKQNGLDRGSINWRSTSKQKAAHLCKWGPRSPGQSPRGDTFSTDRRSWNWTGGCSETPWPSPKPERAASRAPPSLSPHSPLEASGEASCDLRCKCIRGRYACLRSSYSARDAAEHPSRTSNRCRWP